MIKALIAVLLLALPAAGILADDDHDRVLRWRQEGRVLPLEQILDRFDPDRRFQVIEIELEDEHGLLVYEIKYLDARGRIRKTQIDAGTGEPVQDEAR
jgi:uncharacterized membrane protein YkoI